MRLRRSEWLESTADAEIDSLTAALRLLTVGKVAQTGGTIGKVGRYDTSMTRLTLTMTSSHHVCAA